MGGGSTITIENSSRVEKALLIAMRHTLIPGLTLDGRTGNMMLFGIMGWCIVGSYSVMKLPFHRPLPSADVASYSTEVPRYPIYSLLNKRLPSPFFNFCLQRRQRNRVYV